MADETPKTQQNYARLPVFYRSVGLQSYLIDNYGDFILNRRMKKFAIFASVCAAGLLFADNEHYDNQTISDSSFYGTSMKNSTWKNAVLNNVEFSNTDLTNADFSGAILDGDTRFFFGSETSLTGANFTDAVLKKAAFVAYPATKGTYGTSISFEQIKSTKSFKDGNLSNVFINGSDLSSWNFSGLNMTNTSFKDDDLSNADFSNANLTGAYLSWSKLDGANFTDAVITGAGISGLTVAQLYQTADYKAGKLNNVSLRGSNLAGVDFSGKTLEMVELTSDAYEGGKITNLKNANFNNAVLAGVTFAGSDLSSASFAGAKINGIDLRGATYDDSVFASATLVNVIKKDGSMVKLRFNSAEDRIYIPEDYVNGNDIKLSEESAKISGGAVLELEEAIKMSIENGKTLTVSEDGTLVLDAYPTPAYSGSESGIVIGADSALVFESNGVLIVSVDERESFPHISPGANTLEFYVISWEDGAEVSSLYNLIKGTTIRLLVDGIDYDLSWDFIVADNKLTISMAIPEPAEYAAVFGALALLLAAYRRSKR